MEPTTGFIIGVGANKDVTQDFPGSLLAIGTAAKPIVFTSTAATPAPGDWMGFKFEGTTTPANDLDHVSIAYAGGSCSCNGFGCAANDNSAVVILNWMPAAPFVTNSSIVKSAHNGVLRGWVDLTTGPSFLMTNTFDVAGCPETPLADPVSRQCPMPLPCP
jgi:hypothetical protein